MQKSVVVVIPNWNGAEDLSASIDSVLAQSYDNFVLVIVDNGSTDNSKQLIETYKTKDARVRSIYREKNYGYTGGVNPGIELAIQEGALFVAPFNNDAVAHKDWLKHLMAFMQAHPHFGIAACKMLHADGKTIDSTAEQYSIWGLPYPRGRDEPTSGKYDKQTTVFGASGGASIYRTSMLAAVGGFDQDFFAYYEDTDLSFRAQLAGWKVGFVPNAIVYHEQGKTSSAMRSGFITYQYMKNLPMVTIKDVPARLLPKVVPRFWLAYTIFFINAFLHGKGWPALKGWCRVWWVLPKKLVERRRIQKGRKVTADYIWNLFVHDLPPNAAKLRKLRSFWWRLTGKHSS